MILDLANGRLELSPSFSLVELVGGLEKSKRNPLATDLKMIATEPAHFRLWWSLGKQEEGDGRDRRTGQLRWKEGSSCWGRKKDETDNLSFRLFTKA